MRALATLLAALVFGAGAQAAPRCLSDCTPRIGIVSAFGAEADILIAQTQKKRSWTLAGKRYTTGLLRGQRVVIVLSGVSMVNAAMVTQQMLDHFRIERLIMSGIAGGLNPALHVGDVTVPERWAMPMEVYWNDDTQVPAPCGQKGDVGCLGLKLATGADGQPLRPYAPGLFMRETHVLTAANAPKGEFRFDYPVDAEMLAVARTLTPKLERCGPKARQPSGEVDATQCVREQPQLRVGGLGVSATVFLANADYRQYLFETLKADTFEMETAALAHVAHANGVPYIALRSISDLAGATEFNADVGALFMSGLAEANEAAVTLAFLDAWTARIKGAKKKPL
ncbi:5'-methylthioadenosine/S-adenosylhomocysteine nucleosidase [Rhizobacter sp. J219]|uniref:5'-methylthioadenosine/S-adenosylhomocysteine nucleosidase n=1 Tax=Rhizobacter sp. J219 TaxID=2898430 RepID=UPI002150C59F|nr:5'-methylthioadenosine/S-adenosylhomocysteine nucleosidase [Rhizobacter sp. J219]MCR5884375.1 5'-methylthioadenosine/S-adenosylhomocysteine nucleosidase [Rhizobacter sp. J219]